MPGILDVGHFYFQAGTMGRILGLDVGDKTIGVAVSDELGWTAQGVTTVQRQGKKRDLAALAEFVERYDVAEILVGLPRHLNHSLGGQAEKVQAFARSLEGRFSPIPITFWDERLSTVAAERVLLEADVSRKKRKQVIDRLAAVIILQNYLDASQP